MLKSPGHVLVQIFLFYQNHLGKLGKNTKTHSRTPPLLWTSDSQTAVASEALGESSKFTKSRSHPRPSKPESLGVGLASVLFEVSQMILICRQV